MTGTGQSQQFLLKQGLTWLKTSKDKLARDLVNEMNNNPELSQQRMPGFIRKLVAADMLNDLIKRVEENTFDAEAVQVKMLTGLKKGATVESQVISISLMMKVIENCAKAELDAQPQMRDLIISRVGYFAALLKSMVATASIEYERTRKTAK